MLARWEEASWGSFFGRRGSRGLVVTSTEGKKMVGNIEYDQNSNRKIATPTKGVLEYYIHG